MNITWHFDAREDKYYREMVAMGKALADLRNLIRQKRAKKLGDAKISYDELDNILDNLVKEKFHSQL
tara:strand:+ start:1421 stop:1621 length:201 start_codon:yes stop_codon:yes gene_type:complete